MKVFGYGEDALTLWALTYKTKEVLCQLGDGSSRDDLTLIYRPSFGRKGGANSAQFGEFDFILGTPKALYLGEAKWDKSPEVRKWDAGKPKRDKTLIPGKLCIELRDEQSNRHNVFKDYYKEWISEDWNGHDLDFLKAVQERLQRSKLEKAVPPPTSILFNNLKAVLELCAKSTNRSREVRNVLLVIDTTGDLNLSQSNCPPDFKLVYIKASKCLEKGLIPLVLEGPCARQERSA